MSPGRAALAAALLATVLAALPLSAQQNHVVVDRFDWKVRSTDHFDIYYYEGSAPLVNDAALILEEAFARVTKDLDIPLVAPPWTPKHMKKRYEWARRPFFLYASPNDFQQNNIAFVGDGTGGVTEPFKDRFLVYNDGSLQWLAEVITHEFVHVAQYHLLISGPWRTGRILKSILYPLWMIEGMPGAFTHEIEANLEEMTIRDAATSGGLISLTRLERFGHLKPHQIVLAYKEGSAALEFMASQYGSRRPGDMLRLFEHRFDTGQVLTELLGLDAFAFDKKFREYTEEKYAREARVRGLREPWSFGGALTEAPGSIPAFNTAPVFTPDGKSMYHLSTELGHPPILRRVDLETGRIQNVRGVGYVPVENIPQGAFANISRVLAISPDGKRLAFAGSKNHRDRIFLYDIPRRKLTRLPIEGFQGIEEPQFSPDGRKLVFSGLKAARSDLYLYDLESRSLEALTSDDEDDSMPAFSPDGRWIVFSRELSGPTGVRAAQRRLFRLNLGDRSLEPLEFSGGEARDPLVSSDGRKILFVLEKEGLSEAAELDLASGRVTRLTRTVGGTFTPTYAPGGEIAFSSLREGNIRIFKGPRADFLDELVPQDPSSVPSRGEPLPPPPGVSTGTFAAAKLTSERPYRFSYSTDLFIPAIFYSSIGGLFVTGYWQGSDLLGNNQSAAYLSFHSGTSYSYGVQHAYYRFRPQLFVAAEGYGAENVLDADTGHGVDQSVHKGAVGVSYPLDRYHRLEAGIVAESDATHDLDTGLRDSAEQRGTRLAFVRDTVRGRYLVATRGDRLLLSYGRQGHVLGGSTRYTAAGIEGHEFVPTGGQSTLALRAVAERVMGPDSPQLILGGLGGVRGYGRSTVTDVGDRLAALNAEWRFPIFPDLNYYMWYIFPDFYFKALFGSIFADTGYAWQSETEVEKTRWRDLRQSVGLGMTVYTFVLQEFSLVISMDYAQRTTSRGGVFYVYLGHIF